MFILRTISESHQWNVGLGKSYTFIATDSEMFKEIAKSKPDVSKLIGFLLDEFGTEYPLSGENSVFIMTESGKTFARLG